MIRYTKSTRSHAIRLREQGRTYSEIEEVLGMRVPKSTMYCWFRGIALNSDGAKRIEEIKMASLKRAQGASVVARAMQRAAYFVKLESDNLPLVEALVSDSVRKIILATLYLAEGTKTKGGQVVFGNSDPGIITLFLSLLRETYPIDEDKFRCTLQCRADQDIEGLERFWSRITGIPPSKFYKARIDPRSIGKISKKTEYKGVCRIDYFSSDLLYELMTVGSMLKRARSSAG